MGANWPASARTTRPLDHQANPTELACLQMGEEPRWVTVFGFGGQALSRTEQMWRLRHDYPVKLVRWVTTMVRDVDASPDGLCSWYH